MTNSAPTAAVSNSLRAWLHSGGQAVRFGLADHVDACCKPTEDPAAVFRSAVDAELGWAIERGLGCGPDCVIGCEGTGRARMFRAVPGQVRAVREFVREALADHLATEDTVTVASELASNTVAHSGSGQVGAMFTVHVNPLGPQAAGLVVTELRGAGVPEAQDVSPDATSGRGLAIVNALTDLFWVSDGPEIRILFATIPAPFSDAEP